MKGQQEDLEGKYFIQIGQCILEAVWLDEKKKRRLYKEEKIIVSLYLEGVEFLEMQNEDMYVICKKNISSNDSVLLFCYFTLLGTCTFVSHPSLLEIPRHP